MTAESKGRYVNFHGYVNVKDRTHPYASRDGWVLEHRHVMEQTIGRYLYPNETVHHLNGDKQDNRSENLELWSSRHPKGQRVSDKIAWAVEFLGQYGYAVTKKKHKPNEGGGQPTLF